MKKEEWNIPMGLTEEERKLYRMTAKDYLDFNAICCQQLNENVTQIK